MNAVRSARRVHDQGATLLGRIDRIGASPKAGQRTLEDPGRKRLAPALKALTLVLPAERLLGLSPEVWRALLATHERAMAALGKPAPTLALFGALDADL